MSDAAVADACALMVSTGKVDLCLTSANLNILEGWRIKQEVTMMPNETSLKTIDIRYCVE